MSGFFADEEEDQKVVAFMEALDTGLAPCTAWQATAVPGAGQAFIDSDLAYIEAEAVKGNCDVAVYAQWLDGAGDVHTLDLAWNHNGDNYFLPNLSTIDGDALVSFVTANGGHATFVGLPLGMGWRQGVDRDYDGLTEPFEAANGTNPVDPDTDGDGFTDYHEVTNEGMNPLVPDEKSTDEDPPGFNGEPAVVFTTTNSVKIELNTDEPTSAVLSWNGNRVTSPLLGGVDVFHTLVLGSLPANTTLNLQVEIFDPARNRDARTVPVTTLRRQITDFSTTSHDILVAAYDPETQTATVAVDVGDQLGDPFDAVYIGVANVYYEDDATELGSVANPFALGCVVDGHTLTFDVAGISFAGSPESRKLHVSLFDLQHCSPATGPLDTCLDVAVHCIVNEEEFEEEERPYIEGEDVESFATIGLP